MKMNNINSEKSGLVKKIKRLQSFISEDELKDINKLYDRYVSIKRADIIRLKSYQNFISSYVRAKYQ